CLFFFLPTTTPSFINTLSLHDALPIFFEEELFVFHQRLAVTHFRDEHFDIHTQPPFHISQQTRLKGHCLQAQPKLGKKLSRSMADRKSTRLNSSHDQISYAVFCLKKKI